MTHTNRRVFAGSPYSEDAEAALRRQAKAELRKRLRAVRSALPRDARATRSESIARRVLELPRVAIARTVMGYVPMRGEVDPRPVLAACRAKGGRVVLPRLDWGANMLTLHAHDDDGALEESGYGSLQPPGDWPAVPPDDVDLVLVPALAVDPRGHRLGYGGGFYDRLLPTLTRALRVAILYDFQLLAEIPDTPGDVPVDHVVTDRQDFQGSLQQGASVGPGG